VSPDQQTDACATDASLGYSMWLLLLLFRNLSRPPGGYNPRFLCNTPTLYTAKGVIIGGVNYNDTIKSIIDMRLQ